MPDRKKIIENMNIAKAVLCSPNMITPEMRIMIGQTITDAISTLKEQNNCENCAIAIEDRQPVVRCKDCIHRGNAKKCILAAVAEIKNCPVFLFDNSGEWFCADGKRGET